MKRDALSLSWWEPIVALLGAAALLTSAAIAWPAISRATAPARSIDWSQVAQVDLSPIAPGTVHRVMFRGRPVFVFHRTPEQIASARAGDQEALRHRERDEDRLRPLPDGALNPQFLIIYGSEPGRCLTTLIETEGFMDPCRGTRFDFSGRVRTGPADGNLTVPPHSYASDTLVFIGVD